MSNNVEKARRCRALATDLKNEPDLARWRSKFQAFCDCLAESVSQVPENDFASVASELLPLLEACDLQVGGRVAITLGAMIEDGLDTKLVRDRFVAPFKNELATLKRFLGILEDEIGESEEDVDEESGIWVDQYFVDNGRLLEFWNRDRTLVQSEGAIENWCLPMVAILKRDEKFALQLQEVGDLMSLCDELAQSGTLFVRALVRMLRNERLLILHPSTQQGFVVRPKGVTHNFQLQVLLADSLVRGVGLFGSGLKKGIVGRRPSASHVATMKNEVIASEWDTHGSGIWDCYTWRSIGPDGQLLAEVARGNWIWGEGIPSDIEPFEGERVIVLSKPSYERSWSAGPSFHDLSASLEVLKILSKTEVTEWMQRIGAGQNS